MRFLAAVVTVSLGLSLTLAMPTVAEGQGGIDDSGCHSNCVTWSSCGGCMRGGGAYAGVYSSTCSCASECVTCGEEEQEQDQEFAALSDASHRLAWAHTHSALVDFVADHGKRVLLNEEQNAVVILGGCQVWSPALVTSVDVNQWNVLKELGVASYEEFIASGDGTVEKHFAAATPKELPTL